MAEYVTQAQEEVDEMFECSSCQMSFSSVMEHVRKYHNGQNVVIEMDDGLNQDDNAQENEEIEQLEEESEEDLVEYVAEEDSQVIKNEPEGDSEEDEPLPEPQIEEDIIRPISGRQVKIEKDCIVGTTSKAATNSESARATKETEVDDDWFQEIELDYKCKDCGTVFANNKSLRLHLKMHKPVHQKTIEESIQSDMRGVKEDVTEQKTTFHCEKCNKDYDEVFLAMHLKMHSDEPSYLCNICNKKFDSEEHFAMHQNAHQELRTVYGKQTRKKDTPRPYSCQYCDKKFIRPHEKVKHERIHTGEKPHVCEVCGKAFRVVYCLTLHMRTHTMVRPYVCATCGRRFKAHAVYNHHLKTHSEERNYPCPYCPKKFKTSVQLAGHKNSHTKPFSCTECNRPFASLYSVKAHMEMHRKPANGLRYKCSICGATYARNSSVKDHIKEAHSLMDGEELVSDVERSQAIPVEILDIDKDIAAESVPIELQVEEIDDEVLMGEAEWIN